MAVELGVDIIRNVASGDTLPLVIKPSNIESSSIDHLKNWISDNQTCINEYLLEYGAILFKGFLVEEGIQFQDAVQCYEKELSNEYRGTSPRRLIPGTQFVFSASELPPYCPIPQHLEMSFLPAPPSRLFFCCLEAPTSFGGETALCDFKKVYDQLDVNVRDQFESKGVMYFRNYPHCDPGIISEPLLMKGWESVFDTNEKEVVEKELKDSMMKFEWSSKNDLCITNKASAIELHPQTGDKIWFNHLAVFHWTMIHQELIHIYKRQFSKVYYLLLALLMWFVQNIFVFIKGPTKMALHTSYGDGSEISPSDVAHVRDTIYKNMVFNRWEKGDLLMIDNFRVSHGRQPFSGNRKIVVAWARPHLKPSFSKSVT